MGKVSVFKFNVNGQNSEYAKNMVGNYLNTRGFKYNNETNYFETPDSAIVKDNAETSHVLVSKNPCQRGLQYVFEGNQLIIKAYVITGKKRKKSSIHLVNDSNSAAMEYMTDLRLNLFKSFEARFISKISTNEEDIEDGSGGSGAGKIILIILILLLIIAGVGYFVFLRK